MCKPLCKAKYHKMFLYPQPVRLNNHNYVMHNYLILYIDVVAMDQNCESFLTNFEVSSDANVATIHSTSAATDIHEFY